MCFFWLIAMSFVMTVSVEALAEKIGISDAVAGLTISAAGTSFPNLIASMIVARQGLGNMGEAVPAGCAPHAHRAPTWRLLSFLSLRSLSWG